MAESSIFISTENKPLTSKRAFCSPVVHNNTLYVVGGCDASGKPVNCFDKFDSFTEKWVKLPDMPLCTAQPCVLAVDKFIVVLGGVAVNQDPLDVVQIFDLETEKWKSGDRMKEKLLGVAGVVHDGKVVVVGGMGLDTNPKDFFMSYDVHTNKWQALSPMPTARYATFVFLVGSKLYVVGGRQGKLPTAAFEVYDFDTKGWRELPKVPTRRVFVNYVKGEDKIFSLGGLKENALEGFTDTCEIFDMTSEQWRLGRRLITARGDFAATYINGHVVVAGGLGNAGQPIGDVEAYNSDSDQWTTMSTPLPSPQCSASQVVYQGGLYIIGGLSLTGPTDAVSVVRFA